MLVRFECLYCGHCKEANIYNTFTIKNEYCNVCKDKNLKVTDLDKDKIDYYYDPSKSKEDNIPVISPLDDYDDYL